jgi:hypothetical protein
MCKTSSPTSWPCTGWQVKVRATVRLTVSPSASVSSTSWDSWPDISQCRGSLFRTVLEGRLWRESGSVLCQESLSLSVAHIYGFINCATCAVSLHLDPVQQSHAVSYLSVHIKFQPYPTYDATAHSLRAGERKNRVSIPDMSNRSIASPNRPNKLRDASSLLLNMYEGTKLITHHYPGQS